MSNPLPPVPILPISEVFNWRQWFTTLQQNVTLIQTFVDSQVASTPGVTTPAVVGYTGTFPVYTTGLAILNITVVNGIITSVV